MKFEIVRVLDERSRQRAGLDKTLKYLTFGKAYLLLSWHARWRRVGLCG